MVSPIIALLALGGLIVGFVKVGGITGASADLLGSDFSGKNQTAQSGQVTTPQLQKNPSIPIPQGSQTTVATIQGAQILRTDVNDKRKLNQNSSKPQIKTVFDDQKSGGSRPQQGFIPNSANTSTGIMRLNAERVGSIRAQPFTKQEQQDIKNLQTRFNSKSIAVQNVKDSPEEVVQQKRIQAEVALQSFDSKSVQNPNFAIGLPSDASQSDIDLALRQRQERDQVLVKVEQNRILGIQREKSGEQILQTINKSGMNQKQFLQGVGINLNGGNLNAKAIARLREQGLL